MYQSQGSGAATAAGTSALNAGLSPVEASQLSGDTMAKALQAFAPVYSGLRNEQAGVPVQAANAQQGLMQGLYLPMMGQVGTYDQAVAGTRNSGTNTTSPSGAQIASTMLQALQMQQQQEQAAQSNRNYQIEYAMKQQQMQDENNRYLQGLLATRNNQLAGDQQQTAMQGNAQNFQNMMAQQGYQQQSGMANQNLQNQMALQQYIRNLNNPTGGDFGFLDSLFN
jgi:hypothetical protein